MTGEESSFPKFPGELDDKLAPLISDTSDVGNFRDWLRHSWAPLLLTFVLAGTFIAVFIAVWVDYSFWIAVIVCSFPVIVGGRFALRLHFVRDYLAYRRRNDER